MDARFNYRETDARAAHGVQLVVLLYEQMIHDLRRAVQCLERRDVEQRTRHINHALLVVSHLQCTLDLSVNAPVTQNLAQFYHVLRQALVRAQATASRPILEQQISVLLEIREAWAQATAAATIPAQKQPSYGSEVRPEITGWKG